MLSYRRHAKAIHNEKNLKRKLLISNVKYLKNGFFFKNSNRKMVGKIFLT